MQGGILPLTGNKSFQYFFILFYNYEMNTPYKIHLENPEKDL